MERTELGPVTLYCGDNAAVLPTLPDASVDVVLTDPPYPGIKRSYGVWTEAEWWDLMMGVCREVRRVLKPTGSAVFILQPNSRKVGSMRGWLWEFMAWACREWNMVQDAWWWNHATLPTGGACKFGLMRPSLKACIWCGPADCYRSQDSVLWSESDSCRAQRLAGRCGKANYPSTRRSATEGPRMDKGRINARAAERGGTTPFNVLPMANANSATSAGAHGHGAGTPTPLCEWWVRYLCPDEGVVLDPFSGSGTVALAALKLGRRAIGIERMPEYHAIARRRVEDALKAEPLYATA